MSVMSRITTFELSLPIQARTRLRLEETAGANVGAGTAGPHWFGCRAPDATVVPGWVNGKAANGEGDGVADVVLRAEPIVEPQALASSASTPRTISHCVALMFLCMQRQPGQIVIRPSGRSAHRCCSRSWRHALEARRWCLPTGRSADTPGG